MRDKLRKTGFIAVLLALGLLNPARKAGGETLAYDKLDFLSGTIYAKGSDEKSPLFTFTRKASRSGSTLNVLREFAYPDGKLASRQRLVYEGNDLVSIELEELQIGAQGSAKITVGPSEPKKHVISFQYGKTTGGRSRSTQETVRGDALTDDMVGPFLTSHWDNLSKGEALKCRYISIPRGETVGFTFTKDSESQWHGQQVVVIKMAPSSMVIAALVNPLYFMVEKQGAHRVLRYTGRTTPKIKVGNKWSDLDAVTVFDWK